jgi:hypothetical protein
MMLNNVFYSLLGNTIRNKTVVLCSVQVNADAIKQAAGKLCPMRYDRTTEIPTSIGRSH